MALNRFDLKALGVQAHQLPLGKKPVKHDLRTLPFERYLRARLLPPLPKVFRWGTSINSWLMLYNDRAGCCTISSAGHIIMQRLADARQQIITISDPDIIRAYTDVTALENNGQGYNAVTGANDNGCYLLDVLKYWRTTGIAGHRIGAFVQLEAGNLDHLIEAAYLFGNDYIGVNLPLSAQDQINAGQGWDVLPDYLTNPAGKPGSWGGHGVPIVAVDLGGVEVVTWGGLQHMTWAFIKAYCDETYTVLDAEWLRPDGKSPSGFDMGQLSSDLQEVAA
jgi:hypothetical protein